MLKCMLVIAAVAQIIGAGYAHAEKSSRLEALLSRLGVSPSRVEHVGPSEALRPLALTNTGEAAETLFCLTFNQRETKQMLRKKGHAYVCFNFLQNPSEAVGNILSSRGQQRCLITGFFEQGETLDDDCLILVACGSVLIVGSCS